jgi:hypothetical protein
VDFCQQLDKHVLEANGSIASEGWEETSKKDKGQ